VQPQGIKIQFDVRRVRDADVIFVLLSAWAGADRILSFSLSQRRRATEVIQAALIP
jgi:hypothetical protein